MTESVTVHEGDCCSSPAASHGIQSYHNVYDDGANAALKRSSWSVACAVAVRSTFGVSKAKPTPAANTGTWKEFGKP
jgi:hypothetical protein